MKIIRNSSIQKIRCFDDNALLVFSDKETGKHNSLYCFENDIETTRRYCRSKYNIEKTYPDKKTVIYNTLHDSIVVFNPEETEMYYSMEKTSLPSWFVARLLNLGIMFIDSAYEENLIRLQKGEMFFNRGGIPTVTILPTQACNARCEYCFAEHNKKITMTKEAVDDTVRFFSKNFSDGDKVVIRWFGGEPLVAKHIIDQIISGVNNEFSGNLNYESIMFTNGSLLTKDIIVQAKKEWKLSKIQLTIDGYREEHNQRKNYINPEIDYYEKVVQDISVLLGNNISVDCRVNLDKDNIKQLDWILQDLLPFRDDPLFRVRLTVLRPSDCGFNRFNYITPSDLYWAYEHIYNKLIEYKFVNDIQSLFPHRQTVGCILFNTKKIIIGADGRLYKCLQEVLDINHSVGTAKNGISPYSFINNCSLNIKHQECDTCKFYPVCGGGCEAYWRLMATQNISPCKREKYFIDLLLDYVYRWWKNGSIE